MSRYRSKNHRQANKRVHAIKVSLPDLTAQLRTNYSYFMRRAYEAADRLVDIEIQQERDQRLRAAEAPAAYGKRKGNRQKRGNVA